MPRTEFGARSTLKAAASLTAFKPASSVLANSGSGLLRSKSVAGLASLPTLASLTKPSKGNNGDIKRKTFPSSHLRADGYGELKKAEGHNVGTETKSLATDTRTFTITSNPEAADLQVVRSELESRGLVEYAWAPGQTNLFSLKWGSKDFVNYEELRPPQMVNHFQNDRELTTKSGLARNIHNAIYTADADPSSFYPEAFCLNNEEGIKHFSKIFKGSKALCVLKAWINHLDSGGSPSTTFPEGVVQTALDIMERRWQDLDTTLASEENDGEMTDYFIPKTEWDVLQEVDFSNPSAANVVLKRRAKVKLLREQREMERKIMQGKAPNRDSDSERERKNSKTVTNSTLTTVTNGVHEEAGGVDDKGPILVTEEEPKAALGKQTERSGEALVGAVRAILEVARRDKQFGLYRNNLWILKPAGELQGHGITVEHDLEEIVKAAKRAKEKLSRHHYVCQKYIENPLMVGGQRKHDLRQWVMVTSINPLTIWLFSECYVKVAINEYQTDDLRDTCSHLTHTTTMRKHPNFDPEDEYWCCQWSQATYRKLLMEKFGSDVWTDKVLPSMKRIAIASISSVQELFAEPDSSKCCFQVFGFDFMLDEEANVWLLEVNDIPMLSSTSHVSKRLCNACIRETIGLAINGDEHEHGLDLRYNLVYRGSFFARPPRQILNGLFAEGKKCKRVVSQKKLSLKGDSKGVPSPSYKRRSKEVQNFVEQRSCKEEQDGNNTERSSEIEQALTEVLVNANL